MHNIKANCRCKTYEPNQDDNVVLERLRATCVFVKMKKLLSFLFSAYALRPKQPTDPMRKSRHKLMKQRPKYCRYYDLIHVPHGHIPTPKTNLWSHLPLPVKAIRGSRFYYCPCCGQPSFFKIRYACWTCEEDFAYDADYEKKCYARYRRRERRRYFKQLFKRIEYLFLPILVLLGKAWYVRSVRRHYCDYEW